MNPGKSLWGDLPLADVTRTPVIILREQATILTKLTNGLLEGIVTTRTTSRSEQLFNEQLYDETMQSGEFPNREKEFGATLGIVAAALDGYTLFVLTVEYDLVLYPVTVVNLSGGEMWHKKSCNDEAALTAAIGEVLSSERVKKAIGLLLTQSRSTESDVAA